MKTKLLHLAQAGIKMDADEAHNTRKFEGYASVFNGIDAYGDRIAPGAYTKTLKDRDRPVQMRWNHFGPVIGRWDEMYEDEKGLYVKGSLTPGHSVAEDAYASVKFGAISGLSIGYSVTDSDDKDGVRLLKEIDLFEISVVEEPADNHARISDVKRAAEDAKTFKEIEAILREEGRFSRDAASLLVSRIKSLAHGERVEKEASNRAVEKLLKMSQL